MEFHDWCQWFTHASVCRIVNTRALSLQKTWHEGVFSGRWVGRSAGGCINNRETFLHNPQYSFTLRDDQEVILSVMQKDPPPPQKTDTGEERQKFSIGYSIMKVEENRKYRLHTIREEAGSVTFSNRRSVFGRFNLTVGRYVVVPSTFEPDQEREFLLRVYSERNVHPVEMKKENPTRGCCSFLCCCCVNPPQALIQVDVLNAHGLETVSYTHLTLPTKA